MGAIAQALLMLGAEVVTPPASMLAGDPYYPSVSALLRFNGANASTTFVDQIGNTWAASGNAQITTSTVKYGSGAGLFDGTGDYLSATITNLIGAGDFTVDAWIRIASLAADGEILCISDAAMVLNNFNLVFEYKTTGALRGSIQRGSSGTINVDISSSASALSVNTWYHVAFQASGTTATLWIDGVQAATGTITGTRLQAQTSVRIGHLTTASSVFRWFNGRIDDLRVTRGVARYTGTFTPPAAEAPSPFALVYNGATFSTASSNDAQGVATDGTHIYFSDSTNLYKYDNAGSLVTSRSVTGDNPTTKTQINGLFYRAGVLYASAGENSTPRISYIVEYNPSTLAYVTHRTLSGDRFSEGAVYAWGYWWVVFHATKVVAQYTSTWSHVADHNLTFPITGTSGGFGGTQGYDGAAWIDGYLVCTIHNIYTTAYIDVYYWNPTTPGFDQVARLIRPSSKCHQGLSVNPTDITKMLFAERAPSGSDSVATCTITTTA